MSAFGGILKSCWYNVRGTKEKDEDKSFDQNIRRTAVTVGHVHVHDIGACLSGARN